MLVFRSLLLTTLLTPLLIGCFGGRDLPATDTVSGVVNFEGNPIPEGTVQFRSTGESAAEYSVEISAEGRFEASLPLGEYLVAIQPPTTLVEPEDSPPYEDIKEVDFIPEKFREFSTSGLTADVNGENDALTFNLQN